MLAIVLRDAVPQSSLRSHNDGAAIERRKIPANERTKSQGTIQHRGHGCPFDHRLADGAERSLSAASTTVEGVIEKKPW